MEQKRQARYMRPINDSQRPINESQVNNYVLSSDGILGKCFNHDEMHSPFIKVRNQTSKSDNKDERKEGDEAGDGHGIITLSASWATISII
jgi:hypothetical protein